MCKSPDPQVHRRQSNTESAEATGGIQVKREHYERLIRSQMNRRDLRKSATAVSALGAAGMLDTSFTAASAQSDLRKQILQIPGVGKGSPTDDDWQKVGELCLGPTKRNVQAGEFKGVELKFMGLNNQNLHNL